MKVTTLDTPENKPCALALGAFDGLHRGHLAVIRAAAAAGENSAVFTFNSSPSGGAALITERDKRKILTAEGVKRLYSVGFEDVRDIEAEKFVREILLKRFKAQSFFCGRDFRFGKGAKGNVALLQKICGEENVRLTVLPDVEDGGEKISSTRIRAAIKEGDIPTANRLLGRPFNFSLEVVHGNHIGTGLGTPTINQPLPEGFIQPKFGVYASWARVSGEFFCGVTNIGVKPTVGSDTVLAETWMPDFSGDLYGKRVRIFLLDFIRPERKFDSLDTLLEAIKKDAEQAQKITEKHPPRALELEKY